MNPLKKMVIKTVKPRMRDWYAPRDIFFSPEQVFWLIENRGILGEGTWPPECIETGYSGQNGKTAGHSAPFETPVIHHAEVEARMDMVTELETRLTAASIDGKLLVAEIDAGKALSELSYESRTVLNYISGWKRKRMYFSDWRKKYRYRHKMST